MTHKENPFAWVDELLKRWPIIISLCLAVVWLTTMQVQLHAATDNQDKMKEQLETFDSIKSEFPYLKDKVSSINSKIDTLGDKIDKVLLRM